MGEIDGSPSHGPNSPRAAAGTDGSAEPLLGDGAGAAAGAATGAAASGENSTDGDGVGGSGAGAGGGSGCRRRFVRASSAWRPRSAPGSRFLCGQPKGIRSRPIRDSLNLRRLVMRGDIDRRWDHAGRDADRGATGGAEAGRQHLGRDCQSRPPCSHRTRRPGRRPTSAAPDLPGSRAWRPAKAPWARSSSEGAAATGASAAAAGGAARKARTVARQCAQARRCSRSVAASPALASPSQNAERAALSSSQRPPSSLLAITARKRARPSARQRLTLVRVQPVIRGDLAVGVALREQGQGAQLLGLEGSAAPRGCGRRARGARSDRPGRRARRGSAGSGPRRRPRGWAARGCPATARAGGGPPAPRAWSPSASSGSAGGGRRWAPW